MPVTFSQRVFLVGCPRSGTTLLQSLLATHSRITSFPESHFFCNLFGDYEPKRKILGIASRRIRPRLIAFLQECGHTDAETYLPKRLLFTYQYTQAFVMLLDRLTHQQNKHIWIEKTPPHLHYIPYIERQVPKAKFIHIIRDGADVIASIHELRNTYPDTWDGNQASVDHCIDRWLDDIARTARCLDRSHHMVVRYEHLVANPTHILEPLCQFLGVDFEPDMLTGYAQKAKQVSLEREPWKSSVHQPIQSTQSKKFRDRFTPEEQAHILQRIAHIDLDCLTTPIREPASKK